MGPKAFITCYVCFREFGSRSIPFHEPKCLERWRSSNRSLPPEKRSQTPVKPVGGKDGHEDSAWQCPNCTISVPPAKRSNHKSSCLDITTNNNTIRKTGLVGRRMTLSNKNGTPKKKGKENKNSMNDSTDINKTEESTKGPEPGEQLVSTSDKSVRPQTKILRRPTPNLKHPVIQVDSADESGDSSDKSKEDNPKRMKRNTHDCPNEHKPKNFIMYNKQNVEKNTKTSPKERAALSKESFGIPYPCNSCSRSIAPERLHSHSRKDTKGMVLKKASSAESPQKKTTSPLDELPSEDKCSTKDSPAPAEEINLPEKSKTVTDSDIKKILCYVCGKETGSSSLTQHESKCLEKWKQKSLPSPTRGQPNPQQIEPEVTVNLEVHPDPELDSLETIDQLDEMDPAWLVVQSQLVPCPSCNRTFFPERLPVHRKVCKGKISTGHSLSRTRSLREDGSNYQGEEEPGDKQTVYVPCYICQRSFGSWIIQMHESQCLRKWRRENERLPDHLQQQEPHKPQLVLDGAMQSSTSSTLDVAWESHLQQLVPCQRCGRTFFPDRLQIHGRSCKGPVGKPQSTPRNSKIPIKAT